MSGGEELQQPVMLWHLSSPSVVHLDVGLFLRLCFSSSFIAQIGAEASSGGLPSGDRCEPGGQCGCTQLPALRHVSCSQHRKRIWFLHGRLHPGFVESLYPLCTTPDTTASDRGLMGKFCVS